MKRRCKKHVYNKKRSLVNAAIEDLGFNWYSEEEKDASYRGLWRKVFKDSFMNIQVVRDSIESYRKMDYEEA